MGQIKLQSVLLFEFKQLLICHCLVFDPNIQSQNQKKVDHVLGR